MNRAFLIIVIPAFLAGIVYWFILRHLQIHPSYIRLAGAGVVFLAAVALVRYYRKKLKGTGP
jgi:hypothetical protein